MTIYRQATFNSTALVSPDVAVVLLSPTIANINGVQTNILGVVGTASGGPKNTPVTISSYADFQATFGDLNARKFDAGTQVATSVVNGANNLVVVRVTDGTDTAASVTIGTNGLVVTSKYTGTLNNQTTVTVANGSKTGTYRLTVKRPYVLAEVFDNITGTGNALLVAMAAAINNGLSTDRAASNLVVATAGTATTAPTLGTYTLTGGTDGTTTITASTLVGVDGSPATGMYALKDQGVGVFLLADTDDVTSWSAQVAFTKDQNAYAILAGASGQTIDTAISNKASAGVDDWTAKVLLGDWCWYSDNVNNTIRLVSPQGFAAARLANLSPEQSGLNKQILGIVGTQKTGTAGSGIQSRYSKAELDKLTNAGIDVITTPSLGGSYYSLRIGCNASSTRTTSDDSYTRMNNYLATTVNSWAGSYIGRLINPATMMAAETELDSYFDNLISQGILSLDGAGNKPYSVVCGLSNNPQSRTSLGYLQADIKVRLQGIVKTFTINLEASAATNPN